MRPSTLVRTAFAVAAFPLLVPAQAPATRPAPAAKAPAAKPAQAAAPAKSAPVRGANGRFVSTKSAAAAGGAVGAVCNDGSAWSGAKRAGACSGHKGVKTWTKG